MLNAKCFITGQSMSTSRLNWAETVCFKSIFNISKDHTASSRMCRAKAIIIRHAGHTQSRLFTTFKEESS